VSSLTRAHGLMLIYARRTEIQDMAECVSRGWYWNSWPLTGQRSRDEQSLRCSKTGDRRHHTLYVRSGQQQELILNQK